MRPTRLAALALLVTAISCGDATGPKRVTTDLHAARELWQAQNVHSYSLELRRVCYCVTEHTLSVTVVNDSVEAVQDLDAGGSVDPRLGRTVDDLFAFVQSAIDNHAHLINAEFDATFGVPTEIDYDGSEQVADDEISYIVGNFRPIYPQGRLVSGAIRKR